MQLLLCLPPLYLSPLSLCTFSFFSCCFSYFLLFPDSSFLPCNLSPLYSLLLCFYNLHSLLYYNVFLLLRLFYSKIMPGFYKNFFFKKIYKKNMLDEMSYCRRCAGVGQSWRGPFLLLVGDIPAVFLILPLMFHKFFRMQYALLLPPVDLEQRVINVIEDQAYTPLYYFAVVWSFARCE
jgi:hypothetical protein